MQNYTKTQLDKKIDSFLARKFQQYPDLDTVGPEPKQSKRLLRERKGVMHTFLPIQLKVQF